MKVNLKWFATVLALVIGVSSVSAQDITREHCALELSPVIGQFDPSIPRLSDVVREGCFDSFAESVSFATYTLAYMYDWTGLQTNGGTLTVSSSSLCSSGNFYAYNLTSFQSQGNWANRIESWQRASGSACNTGYFYSSTNVAGSYTFCGSPCGTLGSLNNDAESFVLLQ